MRPVWMWRQTQPTATSRRAHAAKASVGEGAVPVPGHRLVARGLTAVPEPGVEYAWRHVQHGRDHLARVDRAGPDLPLLLSRLEQLAGVDPPAQVGLVLQHAVDPQDVRNEIVGKDREAVEVIEAGHARERQVARHDLGALEEPAVIEERHPRRQLSGQPLG